MFHYHAFGLSIASELALEELHPGTPPADVTIRCARGREDLAPDTPWIAVDEDRVVMRLEGIRFTVTGGRAIDILAPDSSPDMDIRIWLLGTVMAALLHQRGYLPIHANVVGFGEGEAAAFAGESGAGKSTLAAWMEMRGHHVLADDLCAIRTGGERPQVFEGIPRMKLWRETLNAFGRSPDGLRKVASDLDKYHVPLRRAPSLGSLEPSALTRVYLLDRAAEGEAFGIEKVAGPAAAQGVLANAFRWGLGQRINRDDRAQFDQCLEVARSAAVFRVRRRWSLDRFTEDAMAIEQHLAAPLG